MSVKELRKILGEDASGLDDTYLRKLSIGIGEISLMLVNNPNLIDNIINSEEPKEGSNYVKID